MAPCPGGASQGPRATPLLCSPVPLVPCEPGPSQVRQWSPQHSKVRVDAAQGGSESLFQKRPRPRRWWALDCTSGRQPSAVTSPCGLSQGPHGASVVSHCPLEMVLWGGLPRRCGNLGFQVTPRIGKGRGPFLSGGEGVSLLWARQADPPPLLVSPPWVTTPWVLLTLRPPGLGALALAPSAQVPPSRMGAPSSGGLSVTLTSPRPLAAQLRGCTWTVPVHGTWRGSVSALHAGQTVAPR